MECRVCVFGASIVASFCVSWCVFRVARLCLFFGGVTLSIVSVPERSKGVDSSSTVFALVGSNPTADTIYSFYTSQLRHYTHLMDAIRPHCTSKYTPHPRPRHIFTHICSQIHLHSSTHTRTVVFSLSYPAVVYRVLASFGHSDCSASKAPLRSHADQSSS